MQHKQSPSQTVGPYFRIGLIYGEAQNDLVTDQTRGQRIRLSGTVYDGDGTPVPDAMLEIWGADTNGIYNHPADPRHAQADPYFRGYGRAENVQAGVYQFQTIKPGHVPAPGGGSQAPHLNVRVFARGMLTHAVTRVYFSDEPTNADDPILALVPAERRTTLIARLADDGHNIPTYHWDVHLQGEQETVFFNP